MAITLGDSGGNLGKTAEDAVECHLRAKGFHILGRNWRRPWGELDIIAQKNGVFHFVEVKASKKDVAGFSPTIRATKRKMSRVCRTARTWLAAHNIDQDAAWQMDVASVIMEGEQPEIEIFEGITSI